MTDPQLPPSPGAYPPVPQAPFAAPAHLAPPAPPAPPVQGAPGYATPPGAYQVPVGGYAAQTGAYAAPAASVPQSPLFGRLALIFSLVAAVVTPIVAGIMSFQIGNLLPDVTRYGSTAGLNTLAFLAPVRDQVLWAELAFWAGTVLGIAAFVFGIIAIAKRRGRGSGIAALIVAVIAPIIFFLVVFLCITIGASVGAAALLS